MKMEKRMMTGLVVLMAATLAHGDIQLDGGSSVSKSLIGANGGLDLRGGYALTDSVTGLAVPLAIGATFDIEFTFQAVAVGDTSVGDKIGYNGVGWDATKSLKLGFGDGLQALTVQFDLDDYNPKIALGGDSDATDETNFKFESGSSDFTSAGVQGTENSLKSAGDTATFNLSLAHTAAQTFDMTMTWGAYTTSYVYTTANVDMLSVSEFYVVANNLDADLGCEVNVVPEPATLGLFGFVGVALIAFRQHSMRGH